MAKKYFISFFILCLLLTGTLLNIKPVNLYNDYYIQQQITQQRIIGNKHATYRVDKKEHEKLLKSLRCMAYNIYYEARGEPFLGQVAVARVVMNRVRDSRFPNNVCDVVYQKTKFLDQESNTQKVVCQFSWVCENHLKPRSRSKSYIQAMDISKKVILQNMWSGLLYDNVLFFHSTSVEPFWGLQQVKVIGRHKFFNDKRV